MQTNNQSGTLTAEIVVGMHLRRFSDNWEGVLTQITESGFLILNMSDGSVASVRPEETYFQEWDPLVTDMLTI